MPKKRTKKRGLGRTAVAVPAPKSVPIKAGASKVAAQPEKIPKYPGESYTSPTILRSRGLAPRGASARRKFGCMEVLKTDAETGRTTKRFTGDRCKGTISHDAQGQPTCSTRTFRDPKCSSGVYADNNSPCATGRYSNLTAGSRCPIQLAWFEGKPVLRLCHNQKEQGELVRVDGGVNDAKALAEKLCTLWSRDGSWSGASKLVGSKAIGLGRARKPTKRRRAR
jgi:hypothetical protein